MKETHQGLTIDYLPYLAELRGVAAGAEDLVLRCAHSPSNQELTIRVESPDGEPVPDVRVQLFGARSQGSATQTDAEGRVRFTGLAKRELTVFLNIAMDHPARQWGQPKPVQAIPDGQELVIAFVASSPLKGTVVTESGAPAAYCSLQVFHEGQPLGWASADREGRFVVAVAVDAPTPLVLRADWNIRGQPTQSAELKDLRPGQEGLRVVVGKTPR